jgi:hypothetical protein
MLDFLAEDSYDPVRLTDLASFGCEQPKLAKSALATIRLTDLASFSCEQPKLAKSANRIAIY